MIRHRLTRLTQPGPQKAVRPNVAFPSTLQTGIQFGQASVWLSESPFEVRFPCRRLRVSSRKMVRGRGRQSPPYSKCEAQRRPISLEGMCEGIIPPERTELCSVEVLPLQRNSRRPSTRQVNQNRLNLVMRWPSFIKHPWRSLLRTTPMVTLTKESEEPLAYFSDQAATSINSGLNVL